MFYHEHQVKKERGKNTYKVVNVNQFGSFIQHSGLTKTDATKLAEKHNANRVQF